MTLSVPGRLANASFPRRLFCSLAEGIVTEPITGYGFAERLCFEQSDDINHCPRLCGVGTRHKRLVGIKQLHVYALRLNVSEEYPPTGGEWADELVSRSDVDTIISCIISSGFVSRKKVVNALDDVLLPVVKSTDSEVTLNRFHHLFDNVTFKKGLHVDFYLQDGSLTYRHREWTRTEKGTRTASGSWWFTIDSITTHWHLPRTKELRSG